MTENGIVSNQVAGSLTVGKPWFVKEEDTHSYSNHDHLLSRNPL